MSAIHAGMTIEEVAALVCETLSSHGIRTVLSGGAVVSIYSDNEYESYDLDFVMVGLAKKTDTAMQELGFRKEKGRHWTHPRTKYWVEFSPGPVQVGNTVIHEVAERETPFGLLRLLPPTECVMDRLTWYYHDNDPQALDQAIWVAARHPIDLDRIEEWSAEENAAGEFSEFLRRLREIGNRS
jgi:hypothetical protein